MARSHQKYSVSVVRPRGKGTSGVPSATVTSKGQITIPKDVRARLGLEAGDRVVFVVHSDRNVVLKPAKSDVRHLHGMLYRKGRRPRTAEEMDDGIARSVAGKHGRQR